jgi:hypothetical protein
VLQSPNEGYDGRQTQRNPDGVVAHILSMPYLKGTDGHQESGEGSHSWPAQQSAEGIHERYTRDPEQKGEEASSEFALSHNLHPEVKKGIVERRQGLELRHVGEKPVPRMSGKLYTEGLIAPERVIVKQKDAHGEAQESQQQH